MTGGATGGAADRRVVAVRAGLWLIAAALGVRQIVAVRLLPPGERLADLEIWTGARGVLRHSLYGAHPFTGTPFAGLVIRPLAAAAHNTLGLAWTFGTLLLVVVLGIAAAHALPRPVTRRTALLAAPVAICLLMLSLPVRNTLHPGQSSVLPVLLVLLGCCTVRGARTAGVLVGLAAALEPAVLLFAPLLWCTGRRRAALSAGATFAVCTALACAALPADSWTYWGHHFAGASLGTRPESVGNQSLHGALLRLGCSGPLEVALCLALAAAVASVGLPRAVRYARDGQTLLAVAVTGCVVVAVSPASWQHQSLWVLLALAGRVGRRAADRVAWQVALVLVMTLPAAILVPNKSELFVLRDNAVLLAALAAACVMPFLSRTAPHFSAPIPTAHAPRRPGGRPVPLLPAWRRALTRPNLVLELLLIRVGYSLYDYVRIAAKGDRAAAERHGQQVHTVERALHADVEHWANHTVARAPWPRAFFDFYYESFHFLMPLAVLGVLYVRRPADFRWARTTLGFATVIALLGFWLYPLAPPRLMPGLGFIDTVHGTQDFSRPDYGALTAVTNQYAAMPSLHFGWALWCGVIVFALARRRWVRALGLLHPLCTLVAIVVTGNHWILDAVGGALVIGAGFALTYLLSGARGRDGTGVTGSAEGPAEEQAEEPAGARDLRGDGRGGERRAGPVVRSGDTREEPGHARGAAAGGARGVTPARTPSAPEPPPRPPR